MNGCPATLRAILAPAFACSVLWSQSQPIVRPSDSPKSSFVFTIERLTDGRRQLSGISGAARSRDGFVWFAGTQELIRYDGFDLVTYRTPWHEKDAKLANWNSVVLADRSGMIWTGTNGGGLKQFNPHTEQFVRCLADPADGQKLSRPTITCLLEDRREVLWIGTPRGVNSLDRGRALFAQFADDTSETDRTCNHYVTSMLEDRSGALWIGTTGGLSRFDTCLHRFVRDANKRGALVRLPNDTVRALCVDQRGLIWAGLQRGIAVFDPITGRTPADLANLAWPDDIAKRLVTALGTDRFNNVWIGTYGGGLFVFESSGRKFTQFRHDPHDATTISADFVERLYTDPTEAPTLSTNLGPTYSHTVIWLTCSGGVPHRIVVRKNPFENLPTVWLGLYEKRPIQIWALTSSYDKTIWAGSSNEPSPGLLNVDMRKQRFTRYAADSTNVRSLGSNLVKQILEDRNHNLWIITRGKVQQFIRSTRDFKTIPSPAPVTCIGESHDGALWIALTDKENYIYLGKLDPVTEAIVTYPRPRETLTPPQENSVYRLHEDTQGIVWCGTFSGGLCAFDTRSHAYRRFLSSPQDSGGLRNNNIRSIVEDSNGSLWIGSDGGLHTFNRRTQKVEFVPHPAYSSGNLFYFFIRDMAYDGHGALWIASDHNLTRFEISKGTFHDFGPDEGLGIERLAAIHYDSVDRKVYLGGLTGIAAFHPDSLVDNGHIPPIVFTSFKIHERPVPLSRPLTSTEEIQIPYRDNFFSFTFAALDFVDPAKNLYMYMMEGFDKEWIHTGQRRYASFTNLEPGTYVFRVKGSNSDGVWNETGASMRILILPPWYRSTPAYISYVILLAAAFYVLERTYRRRLTLRHEMQMKDFEARKLLEIDQIKTRFFANISHEFRTPLTLILGPLERIKSALDEPQLRNDLDVIRRSGQRLLRLVDRLLNLSKVDGGTMLFCARRTDLVSFLRSRISSFVSHAERRGIALKFESPCKSVLAYVDGEMIEEIITNLISNALKFAPRGGEIVVTVSNSTGADTAETSDAGTVSIAVKDTGIGIPPEEQSKVFDRFYQIDNSSTRSQGGTGIGLSLVKELVELHKGSISVSSTPGEGSTFTVKLPLGKSHLRADQVIEEEGDSSVAPGAKITEMGGETGTGDYLLRSLETKNQAEKPLVLLIEDNVDVRQFIRSILESDYRIEESATGEVGLAMAVEDLPDLVVSDIMMPGMDGVEVCRRLKGDERTNHIPVILLTAKASIDSKIEGLETGADDYIVKPFEQTELRARIQNLILLRAKLREKYRKALALTVSDQHISSADERFLKKAIEIVEQHLSDATYDTATFAYALCMSRMSLNRKLQALTGHSTHDFIRALRLHRAAQLLQQRSNNVSEVAYEVGFSSVSHFTKAFREEFGKLPSDIGSLSSGKLPS